MRYTLHFKTLHLERSDEQSNVYLRCTCALLISRTRSTVLVSVWFVSDVRARSQKLRVARFRRFVPFLYGEGPYHGHNNVSSVSEVEPLKFSWRAHPFFTQTAKWTSVPRANEKSTLASATFRGRDPLDTFERRAGRLQTTKSLLHVVIRSWLIDFQGEGSSLAIWCFVWVGFSSFGKFSLADEWIVNI